MKTASTKAATSVETTDAEAAVEAATAAMKAATTTDAMKAATATARRHNVGRKNSKCCGRQQRDHDFTEHDWPSLVQEVDA
ncbi:hypothetical protein CQ12_31645 [Bradyrhizobium jicamae]|uniref:Uncharacterized protein n=1 Tax=Bradyrhizobium jicamae TaxID=280332 RepID=A0A0R3LW54_9BRAD|nr:hypothetical protein [Bradyrhizobium jicamae]KRR12204.1 hypothetical protein CQ12_31645 [Bradyrhizobium jicamae]